MFSCEIAKFLRTAFFIELRWILLSVWWIRGNTVLGICRPSLINQKHNVGWFLLKKFIDVGRVFSLHISRNHSKRFYWLTCRKQKLVQSKTLQQWLFVLILGFWQFRQVFVHYLMPVLLICKWQVATFIKLSLLWIPFRGDVFRKRIDQKNVLL